jgi:hypothetical protein
MRKPWCRVVSRHLTDALSACWTGWISLCTAMQDMTPYLQQLILHGSLDNVEDQKWMSKDSIASTYLKVRAPCEHATAGWPQTPAV